MKQLAAPWAPDIWAENWERFVKNEAWCIKYCVYAKVCHIVGEPYTGRDCKLMEDEENSR